MKTREAEYTENGERYRVTIWREEDSSFADPREYDNNGRMACWHRRYDLGDEQPLEDPAEWLDTVTAESKAAGFDPVVLPVYLYDHSGITISTGAFSCPWDSRQLGWIVATAETLESGGHDLTKLDREQIAEWLRGEVNYYDTWLRGEVYGYTIEKQGEPCNCNCPRCDHAGQWETVDSCGGFITDGGQCLLEAGEAGELDTAAIEALTASGR